MTSDQLVLLGLDESASAGDIVTIVIGTPAGRIEIMGEIEIEGRVLIARKVHIQSDAGPNAFGPASLGTLARLVLTEIDCDEARVEGETRTTGARPGRTPGVLRFTR